VSKETYYSVKRDLLPLVIVSLEVSHRSLSTLYSVSFEKDASVCPSEHMCVQARKERTYDTERKT